MAATTTTRNGAAPKVKEAGDAVTTAARKTPTPAIAAGAAAAGLAGGLLIGSRLAPRRSALGTVAIALADGVRRAAAAAERASTASDDVQAVRDQLEALNKRSPIEVVLDGLTHRRGAHRSEG